MNNKTTVEVVDAGYKRIHKNGKYYRLYELYNKDDWRILQDKVEDLKQQDIHLCTSVSQYAPQLKDRLLLIPVKGFTYNPFSGGCVVC